ncbi:MAG TPA: hypothetical protein VF239_16620 [Vicinamibacterales bacterium]
MKRWIVIVCAVVLGAAAPARAWCEATCLAPTAQGESHCPSHDPADSTTTVSSAGPGECPVLESARPAASARLDVSAPLVESYVPSEVQRAFAPLSSHRPHRATTVFERCTPLRI